MCTETDSTNLRQKMTKENIRNVFVNVNATTTIKYSKNMYLCHVILRFSLVKHTCC